MVAIVTGAGLGTERSSGNVLGAPGQLGSALLGRGNEAVTVNAATGNLILSHQDEFLVGRGPDSAINRVYNSQGAFTDDNADNWRLGMQRRVYGLTGTLNTAGSTVTRTGWDGSEIVYTWSSGRSAYVTTEGAGAYDTITRDGGIWIWTDGDSRNVEYFDVGNNGRIMSLRDTDGNVVSYNYDANGRLTRVLTADGNFTDLAWSGNNLASLTTGYSDTAGGSFKTLTRTRYTYNGGNWLTKVTVDLSPEDGSVADGRVYETTYGYDGGNRVNSIAQTDGALLTFTYDGSGRVASFTQAVENGVSRTTSFGYGSGYTTITDAQGNATTLYHDGAGQLYRMDEPSALSGGNSILSRFDYDASGNLYRTSKYDGAINHTNDIPFDRQWYRYDNNGNLFDVFSEVPGQGFEVQRYYYGSNNQLLTETRYSGLDPDGWAGAEPSGGMTTRYVYDSELHLRFAVSAEGRVTEYRYDAAGNRVAQIDQTYFSATTAGLPEYYVWSEQDLANWLSSIADKSTATRTDTTYDFRGNVAMVTSYARVDIAGNGIPDEGTSRTLYIYDQFGSLLSKRSVAGSASPSMTDLSVHGTGNLSVASAGTIAGKPANLYTVQASGVWTAVYNGFTANEGDVVTYSFTAKGTAGDSGASIGLYGGGGSYWGANEVSLARIVSGPGSISQELGALWNIGGLSTTQETRIEVTRLYRQSESAGVYLYVDRPSGTRPGASLILSDPILSKAATAVETYAYDGMGRMIRFTDAKGVGTWTTYLDAQGRTAVTHANGLVQTNAYNRAGELVSAAETRGGAFDAAYVNSDIATWTTNTTRTSAGSLDGAPATQMTISSGQTYGYNYTPIPVAPGDTITWTISLKALGNSTAHALGLWGGTSNWGTANLSSARVISGPGSIAQHPTSSGYFDVSGLSAAEATRVEITRTFLQAEVAYPHFYTQGATSSAGEGVIVSANSLVVARAGANGGIALNTNDFSIENWYPSSVSSTPAGTLGGTPAVQYTVAGSASGQSQQAVAPNYLDARAGDTVTASIMLMGTSTSGSAAFGIYGHTTGWGYTEDSAGTARIVSGPGTISRYAGNGLWAVTGLSATQATRIEITRTFLEDETASVRLYPDIPNGSILGHSIIAGAPSITRTPGEISSFKYDAAGNVRIARDPGGYRTFYFYDNLRRKVGEVAADGAVIEYKYDAADRLVASVRYAAAYSAGQVAGLYDVYGNPTAVTFATIKSQIGTSAADRWEWNVYDKAGRLIETINRAGAVVGFEYDGAGRVVRTSRYANVLASGTVAGFVASPPTNPVYPASYVGLDRVTRNFYDNDGLLIATLDAEYYLTEYLYDKAGRQVEAVSYYGQPATAYVLNGTLAQIKSTQPSHANDARNYTIYDGRGLVAALIDGEGDVTRFAYDAAGNVIQEVRGQKVTPGTAYTLATLPAASGQLQVVNYLRNVLGQVTSQTEVVSGGNLTSTLAYGWAGDVTIGTDARGNATNRYYDARGRMVLEEVAVAAGVYPSSRYEYDSRGNLVKAIDARGNASYHYYDTRGRLVLAIDAEGYATRTTYNAFGEVASVTRYYNRASGIGNVSAQPTVTADARDATTSFTYDIVGLVASTTDANGAAEYFYHNAFGEKSQWNNKLGGATGYSYNRIGRLYYEYQNKAVVRSDGSTQASGNYNKLYLYDARGNVAQMVEAYALEERRDTFYSYDRADRLVAKQLPALLVFNPANETQATLTPTETYKYDARGNLIETIDPAGGRTLFYYDEADRKIAEIDAVGTHRTFAYDGNGNLTVERTYGTATALPGTSGGTPPAPSGTPREVLYTYDKVNRLVETRIASVQVGQLVGSTYQRPVADIVTAFVYDMMGNLVRENDARGNSVFHYYDKAGREIGKVDQEKYLTTWTRDAEGNVLEERRYANVPATGLNETSLLADIVYWTTASAGDRVTQFAYDKMGRRLTETRLAVAASTVSGNSVATSTQNATITYSYNALGEVLSKTEATGDRTDYDYDAYGRVTQRIDPGFVDADHGGATVRPRVNYYYDAHDALVYERPSEYYSGTHARANRYVYGAGGVLKSLIDTAGATHNYYYSIKGELLRDVVTTTRADGSAVTFYSDKTYDALGRVITERTASYDSTYGWQAGPTSSTSYNAYGDVAAKGIGGTTTEQFFYDNAGRVVKSNAGDGVWKFFLYDAGGNVTLTLTSSGVAHLGHWTLLDALSQAVNNAPIDSTGFNQYYVNASVVVYDKRNLAVDTYEPNRQIANSADVAATSTQTLNTRRWYNAFGEVVQERSARGFDTNYAYNTMGRVIQVQAPQVTVAFEDGTSAQQRPTENYTYDISGRLVGSQNANGFWTTRLLLAGSGYGGGEALVTAEYRPDSTVWQTGYDIYGNARKLTDGLGRVTWQEYDLANRLTKVTKPGGLVEEYAYDALGRVTRHWNSANGTVIYGDPEVIGYGSYGEEIYGDPPVIGFNPSYEFTDYDHQGRVISTKNFAGDLTTYGYAWNGAAATANMGTFGAWTRTTSTIADRYSTSDGILAATDMTDAFGHTLGRTDMGGRSYTYSYNAAGQLAGQTSNAGQSIAYTYYNTGRLAVMADNAGTAGGYSSSNIDGTYTYDADGNRTYEKLQGTTFYYDYYYGYSSSSTVTLQEGKGSYDAMGRLLTFTDAGASGNGAVSITNSYDAAGNVRRTLAVHNMIANNQTLGAQTTEDYWYKYDGLNRMTLVKGNLVSGQIVRGTDTGRSITYNAAGERATQTKTTYYYDPYVGEIYTDEQESYTYSAAGLLTEVRIGDPASLVLRAQTTYDLAGRVTDYREFAGDGSTVQFNRFAISYDARDNVLSETTTLRRYESNGYVYVNYAATANTYAGTGVLASSAVSNYRYKNGTNYENTPDTLTTYNWTWWDSAQQASVAFKPNTGQSTTYNTYYYYDVNGHLTSAYVADGRPRSITYINDAGGQVLVRREQDNTSNGDPKQVWWYFDGKQVGTTGNNGNDDPDYAAAIDERIQTPGSSPGAFRLGATYGTVFSDFDQAYNSLSPSDGGGAGTGYTVRAGDTLESVARAMFGDASLWYLLAEANGLSGAAQLTAGQVLRIPAGAANLHNTSDTFRPYDSARHIGDTLPTTPKPPKKPKCGGFGAILLAVVAVAVTLIALPGAAPTFLQGVLAGAAGSAASQAVGLATGIQKKFDFKGLAMSALAGGVTAGLGDVDIVGKGFSKFMSADKFFNAAIRGLAANALTQGVGVATGLQKRFDWAGVAAAGVGAGVAQGVGGGRIASNLAGGLASSAAQSLLTGKDFGDTLMGNLPGIIGNTIGNMLADWVARGSGAGTRELDKIDNFDEIVGRPSSYGSQLISVDTPGALPGLGVQGVMAASEDRWVSKADYDEAVRNAQARATGDYVASPGAAELFTLVGGSMDGSQSNNIVADWRHAAQFYGGAFGYYEGQADQTARFIRLHAIEDMADRSVVDMLASVNGTADFAKGSWRLAHGEINFENGLSVGLGFAGVLGSAKGIVSSAGRVVAAKSVPEFSKVEQLALNAANGRAFEEAGIRGILSHVGLGKNATAVTRNGVTTIIDSAGRPAGLVEFKDVANLSSSPQLRAQLAEALATRQPYNLVVSSGNKTISGPLLRQIKAVTDKVGGGVHRYDPATDILTSWAK